MKLIGLILGFSLSVTLYAQDDPSKEKARACCSGSSCGMKAMDMSSVCNTTCAVVNYDPDEVVSPLTAKVGAIVKCPVSGVVFEVTEHSATVNYKNEEVYVCCTACAAVYLLDPSKYEDNIIDTRS